MFFVETANDCQASSYLIFFFFFFGFLAQLSSRLLLCFLFGFSGTFYKVIALVMVV